MAPEMFLPTTEYTRTIKIATRCYVAKAVDTIELMLDRFERQWFYDHKQFSHFFHMAKDVNHKTMGMWMLLARMARIEKKKEIWFVVNGTPIRYSLKEHALISGLHCHQYPERYRERLGDFSFVDKHFEIARVTQEDVEEKFLKMKKPSSDRLKMAVLYFLTSVIKGSGKRGKRGTPVDSFLLKIVSDLDECVTFPWGRYTFFDTLAEIRRMLNLFDKVANPSATLAGFIIPLELLPFEAIPRLMTTFREEVSDARSECPRMCKSKFRRSSMKGFTIEEINMALGETKEIESILSPTIEEYHLTRDIEEEDDVCDPAVDGWMRHLVVEGKKVRLMRMYNEDIAARNDKREKGESSKAAEIVDKGDNVEIGESPAGLNDLKTLMENGFRQLTDIVQGMDKRINVIEVAVKEVRESTSAKEVVEMVQGMDRKINMLEVAVKEVCDNADEEKQVRKTKKRGFSEIRRTTRHSKRDEN